MTANNSQALHGEVEALARRLRLPYLRKAAHDVLPTAKAQRWDPAEVVRVLLEEEATGRDAATIRNRRKRAGFPTGKTFDTWRDTASTIPPATQQSLRTLEWIRRGENLAVVGPGTARSMPTVMAVHADQQCHEGGGARAGQAGGEGDELRDADRDGGADADLGAADAAGPESVGPPQQYRSRSARPRPSEAFRTLR